MADDMQQQRQQSQTRAKAKEPPPLVVELHDEMWEQFLRSYDMSVPTSAPNVPPILVPSKAPVRPTNMPMVPVRPPLPTRRPVRPPSPRPVIAPTKRPTTRAPMTQQPVVVPVSPPTAAPVAVVPTLRPARPPTRRPVRPPTQRPVRPPTRAPVVTATQAPVTGAPRTQAPVVATKAPTTAAPVLAPVTKAPTTRAPVTSAPRTQAPVAVTKAPTTVAPALAPVTKAPTTRAPVTSFPVTKAPVTKAPVTKAPVTKAPVTKAPVSKAPVTKAPAQTPIPPLPVARPTVAPVVAAPNVTLLALVQSTPELSTLLSAIQASDANRNTPPFLAPLLGSSTSSLTVFAPTNSAFNALEVLVPGYLARLLTPEYGLHLFSLLGYHVTQGSVLTTRFPVSNLRMFASGSVNVTGSSGDFQVESFAPSDANILPPENIRATNGVAHLVDNVLVPRFVGLNLVTALQTLNEEQGGRFSTLLELVLAADLDATLADVEGVTLLAPTNDAISPETAEFLLRPENADILRSVVSYHVVSELFNFAAQSVPNILLVDTLQDENIVVGLVILDDNSIATTYNQATQEEFFVTQENIGYVIDTLLIPPSLNNVVPNTVSEVSFDPVVVSLSADLVTNP